MMRLVIVCATAATVSLSPGAATARDGGGIAAGIIGGLAIGGMLGAAAAQPRHYGPPPAYVYEREPVYVIPHRHCYWTRGEPMWDDYHGMWIRPRAKICD